MRPVYFLGVFIPAAIGLELAHADPVLVFSAAALGVIPCAAVMGEATEAIAAKSGPGIGGLLNVTFGNAPELIIALVAVAHGLPDVVRASLTGSIIGNLLLVLGFTLLVAPPGTLDRVSGASASTLASRTADLAAANRLVYTSERQLARG